MSKAETLSDDQARQILHTIAAANPDYPAWVAQFPGPAATSGQLPPELAGEVLAVLAEDPRQASAIEAMSQRPGAAPAFIAGGDIATLLAVAFVLRTHVRIKRNAAGKWEFLVEHKPGDSKLLGMVLKKLEGWLGGSDGG